ncbi:MAG: dipeptide/oligopeptide/nickel ABC transporter ATP-binding protein, partial [Deltaproteobacteria bacterium]
LLTQPQQTYYLMPLIPLNNLVKYFPERGGLFTRTAGVVHTVDGVILSIEKGETFSLMGESRV